MENKVKPLNTVEKKEHRIFEGEMLWPSAKALAERVGDTFGNAFNERVKMKLERVNCGNGKHKVRVKITSTQPADANTLNTALGAYIAPVIDGFNSSPSWLGFFRTNPLASGSTLARTF